MLQCHHAGGGDGVSHDLQFFKLPIRYVDGIAQHQYSYCTYAITPHLARKGRHKNGSSIISLLNHRHLQQRIAADITGFYTCQGNHRLVIFCPLWA